MLGRLRLLDRTPARFILSFFAFINDSKCDSQGQSCNLSALLSCAVHIPLVLRCYQQERYDTDGFRGVYCSSDGVKVGYVSQFAFSICRFSKDEHGNQIQTSHNDWYGNVILVLQGKCFATGLKFFFTVVCKGGYVSESA